MVKMIVMIIISIFQALDSLLMSAMIWNTKLEISVAKQTNGRIKTKIIPIIDKKSSKFGGILPIILPKII